MKFIMVSDCGLTKLSLAIVIKGVDFLTDKERSINIELYNTGNDEYIYNSCSSRCIVIFDTDNISPVKIFNTIEKIRDLNPLAFIMIFCRKHEKTKGFIYLSTLSDGILCKTASIEKVEDMLIRLLSSRKEPKRFDRVELAYRIKLLLTNRENEVLECILLGLNNNDISNKLNMKSKTASAHRRNIYNKLGVNSINEVLKVLLLNNHFYN